MYIDSLISFEPVLGFSFFVNKKKFRNHNENNRIQFRSWA